MKTASKQINRLEDSTLWRMASEIAKDAYTAEVEGNTGPRTQQYKFSIDSRLAAIPDLIRAWDTLRDVPGTSADKE